MIDINEIPLIDVHAHADMNMGKGQPRKWFGDELLEIQKLENMPYMLYLAKEIDKVISLAKTNKDKIGAVPWVNPIDEANMKFAEDRIKNNLDVIKGIKIHPAGSGFFVSEDTVSEVFRIANDYNLLIITHTGAEHNQSFMFKPLMEKFPDTKLLLSHCFPIHEACEMVESFNNIFVDTSYTVDNREAQLYLLNRIGKEKIIYSVDGPFWFPKNEVGKYIPQYRQRAKEMLSWYKNDRDAIEHIYYKNAKELLKL